MGRYRRTEWLAYSSVESGSQEVYVQPFPGPGGKVRLSPDSGLAPRWSKNGRELVAQSFRAEAGDRTMEVVVNWFDELRRRVPAGK